jgi:hypothetical protein
MNVTDRTPALADLTDEEEYNDSPWGEQQEQVNYLERDEYDPSDWDASEQFDPDSYDEADPYDKENDLP